MARSSNKARTRSLQDSDYAKLVQLLVARRDASGLSQREVAEAMGWNQSIVAKIEKTHRRLDVFELIKISAIIGFRASEIVEEFESTLAPLPPQKLPKARRK